LEREVNALRFDPVIIEMAREAYAAGLTSSLLMSGGSMLAAWDGYKERGGKYECELFGSPIETIRWWLDVMKVHHK
jgi:hypothetical protein